ncbi:MAG: NAD-dependent succinate-semialdehyde dehydrogenase [Candidatus Sumerlaeia bacterium]|nr:NAD-dependent succinate-semialdehyde dehydrogenase [Candidatus Sumerlaeia bacterium]
MSHFRTVDPASGELLQEYAVLDPAGRGELIAAAASAAAGWGRSPVAERTAALSRCAGLLEERAPVLARAMATEMGKPITQGLAEARKCAAACRYYAERAEDFLEPDPVVEFPGAAVRRAPLGPVLAIMPWNFPLWQVFRHAAPSLAAGNTLILKHAPNVPRCALAIEALARDAGFPEGVVQAAFLDDEGTAAAIADPRVRAVALTGSTRAGRIVAELAGRHLKKCVLELGGSDPLLVFADADLEAAAETAASSRCLNAGQSCIAAKRFLVQRDALHDFLDRFMERMKSHVPGPPLDRSTNLGPLARADLRDALDSQVRRAVADGAGLLLGGKAPERPGYFYPATVLLLDEPKPSVWSEETFGPVAAVLAFDTEDEAVRLANDTSHGLGASAWTRSPERAERLARDLEAGSVFINGLVRSDPALPFGGVKDSGFGRELSRAGLDELVNLKTVWSVL